MFVGAAPATPVVEPTPQDPRASSVTAGAVDDTSTSCCLSATITMKQADGDVTHATEFHWNVATTFDGVAALK